MRGIDQKQMRKEIIKPALMDCVYNGRMLWSAAAEELLIATMAHESKGGYYLVQEGKGGALGAFQDEREDFEDMMTNFLMPKWKKEIYIPDFVFNDFDRIKYDLIYATQIARLHYLRAPEPLPEYDNLPKIWDYYKRWYNSDKGAAQEKEFMDDYLAYTKG